MATEVLFRSQRIPMRWRGGIGMPPLQALGGRKQRSFNRQPEQLQKILYLLSPD